MVDTSAELAAVSTKGALAGSGARERAETLGAAVTDNQGPVIGM